MYDFSGIYHRMRWQAVILFCGCIIGLWFSKFWKKEKFNKKNLYKIKERKENLFIGIASAVFLVLFMLHYSNVLANPEIKMFDGEYIREYRKRGHDFTNSGALLHLDNASEQNLIPGGFVKGEKYRIYYEDRTNVIIRVETID